MEMECAQIEGVIANQCAHWCGNPPVLPRTIGFDLIRPSGTFPGGEGMEPNLHYK